MIIITQYGYVSHVIKMDRSRACELLFENHMDFILHDCCACNLHNINSPASSKMTKL